MGKNEVEREVLALVLVVIILVSLLGTWVILKALDAQQTRIYQPSGGGFVSLVILPPSSEQHQTTLPSPQEERQQR